MRGASAASRSRKPSIPGTSSGAPPVMSMTEKPPRLANASTASIVSRDMTSVRSGPAPR